VCDCAVSAPLRRVNTYEAPTREYTHTNTHKHKQTHNVARATFFSPTSQRKYGADSRRGGALALAHHTSEEGASPPHPPQAASLSRSPTPKLCMYTATDRRCACSASHVDVDQLTSFSYCRFVSLFRTLSCIRRKSRTTGSLQAAAVGLEEQHQQVRDRARQRVGVVRLLVRDAAGGPVRGEKLPLPPAATVPFKCP